MITGCREAAGATLATRESADRAVSRSDAQVGGLWRRLTARFRPASVSNAETLAQFLEQRASLIAQKCAVDYCRGKTGLASYALFTEEPFLKAFDVCRWETFVTVLGDLFIMAEGYLRPHTPPQCRDTLCDALLRHYAAVLAAMPLPIHRPHGWNDAIASFTTRMKAVSAGEPQQALDVADHSAKMLFDTLPIHLRMRELDEEVVYGAVRFRMIAVSQEMQRRFDCEAIANALLRA